MKNVSNSLKDTERIVSGFVSGLSLKKTAIVVGLYGNLGAGKTTFTQHVAKVLGVEEIVTSPTFVIEKIYELPKITTAQKFSHLIHIDAYRLEKSEELLHLGWKEIIYDPKNLIFIEWPEKVADIMPEHIKISFKTLENQDSREINVE